MTVFFQIALRNILRNPRRSLITLTAIGLGLGAIIFLWSFTDGAHRQMVQNITRAHTSDLQVLPDVLEYVYDTTKTIAHPEQVEAILREDPRILGSMERVVGGALVASTDNSMTTYAIGLNLEKEERMETGRKIIRGRSPQPGEENWIGMGERMREILKAEIGDKIILTVQDAQGSLGGEAFRLIGTFQTGNDQIDNQSVILSLQDAQRIYALGNQVSRIAVKLKPEADADAVAADLKAKLKGTPYLVQTWQEMLPMLSQLVHFNNQTVFLVMVVVLTVVSLGILNTMMMSIVQRIHEFGLMMALGTKPHQIAWLVILETLLLTVIGSAIGMLIGVGLTLYFGAVGIQFSEYFKILSNLLMGSTIYPFLDVKHLAISVLVVFSSTFLVSLYPAIRAGKLEPVEAMRQFG